MGFGALADDPALARAPREGARLRPRRRRAAARGAAADRRRRSCRAGARSPSAARSSSRRRPTTTRSSRSSATPTSARRALPGVAAAAALRVPGGRALARARGDARSTSGRFGAPPRGMWPAEGSVSPEALEILASRGRALGGDRRGRPAPLAPADARAARARSTGRGASPPARGEVAMLFRDRGALRPHRLHLLARRARRRRSRDFVSHLDAIGERVARASGHAGPPTVGVFLDGENPWEHYPDSRPRVPRRPLQRARAPPRDRDRHDVRGDGATRPGRASSASTPAPGSRRRTGSGWATRRTAARGPRSAARARRSRAAEARGRGRREAARAARSGTSTRPRGRTGTGGTATTSTPSSRSSSTALFRALVVARVPARRRAAAARGARAHQARRPAAGRGEQPVTRADAARLAVRSTAARRPTSSGRAAGCTARASTAARCSAARRRSARCTTGSTSSALYLRLDPAESPQRTAELATALRVEVVGGGRAGARSTFDGRAPTALERAGRRDGEPLGRAAFARVLELALPFARARARAGRPGRGRRARAARRRRGRAAPALRLPRVHACPTRTSSGSTGACERLDGRAAPSRSGRKSRSGVPRGRVTFAAREIPPRARHPLRHRLHRPRRLRDGHPGDAALRGAARRAEAWIGLLSTGYSAMQFVFAPIWGRLSDRIGRRPVLLALDRDDRGRPSRSTALAPASRCCSSRALFAGAATANIAIAQAYVADVTPPEGRAQGHGDHRRRVRPRLRARAGDRRAPLAVLALRSRASPPRRSRR